jgi:hypothetical protein
VGTHDPIRVRALYLEDGDTGIVLVSADLHSITPELRERVLGLAPADLAENHIILTATHTHNGPGGLSKSWFARRYMGRYMDEMVELVAQGIADAIAEAMAGKKRATIGFKVAAEEGLTRDLFGEGGKRKSQVGVIRVDDSDGNPIAILGSLSAHPTTAPESDVLALSADFPGYFCAELESMSQGDTVAFFLNGALGDRACANREEKGGWDWAEIIGKELALLVKSVANTIDCEEYPVSINYAMRRVPEHLAGRFFSDEVLIQTLEIDRLLVSFLPGEPYAGVQDELERVAKRRGYSAHITVGLANDYLMDIASPDAVGLRGEAPGLNVLGPGAAEWSIDVIQTLMPRGNYSPPSAVTVGAVALEEIAGGYRVRLTGSEGDRIRQLGAAMAPMLEGGWVEFVSGLRDGRIEVDLPLWGERYGIDASPIALPILADRARGLLNAGEIEEIRWFAEGARVPFDKISLLRRFSADEANRIVISIGGDRAGVDGELVGYVASAPPGTPVIVVENRAASGGRSISVGLPWDGVFSIGMDDAGKVLSPLADPVATDFPELESSAESRGGLEEALRDAAIERIAEGDSDDPPVVYAVILEPATKSLYLAVSQGNSFSGLFERFPLAEDSR